MLCIYPSLGLPTLEPLHTKKRFEGHGGVTLSSDVESMFNKKFCYNAVLCINPSTLPPPHPSLLLSILLTLAPSIALSHSCSVFPSPPSVRVALPRPLSLSLFLLQQAALTLMEQHFAINALHTHEPEWDEDADGRADGRTGGRTAGLRNRRTHLYTTRIMDV